MATFERVRRFAKPGAGFSDDDAEQFAQYLDEHGLDSQGADPAEVKELARPEDSPLHKAVFNCEPGEASERYYSDRAAHLVRHIVVRREVGGQEVGLRAYHSVVRDTGRRVYLSERLVWRDPDLAEQVLSKAKAELRLWRARYVQYNELAGVVAAVDEALAA